MIPYVIISSLNYIFAKEAIAFVSPILFNLIRYIVSALIFLGLGGRFIFNRDVLTLSVFTTTSSILWAYGLVYVSPAASAVLSYSMPLFSLPLAFLLVKERPTHVEYLGLGVGFLGVVLYSIPLASHFGSLLGAIMTIINAVFWAGFTVYYRKLRNYSPYDTNFSQFLLGILILLPFVSVSHNIQFTSSFVRGILYTSTLGGAVSFLLWNMLARAERVARLTVMAFSVPIFSTILQMGETREIPSIFQIFGIVLMFLGLLISRLRTTVAVVDKKTRKVTRAV